MEFSVKLAKLPEGFSIPPRLTERMAFDQARGQLSYRGFMTKCTYDELSSFSDDPDYHRALEQLFVLTAGEISPRASSRSVPVAILGASILAAVIGLAVLWNATRNAAANRPISPSPNATASTAR
jgi:hypothetical protein